MATTTAAAPVAPAAEIREELRHERTKDLALSVGRSLLNTVITLVIVVALWQAVVSFGGISPYVAKGPADVWRFLFTGEEAAAHRAELFPLTWVTLKHSALGFAAGMAIALVLAVSFTLSKTVEAGVMPLALLLRSIPLVSIAPVIMLVTGRGTTASVIVIGTIVVLFPALASILFGLSQANPQSLDVVRVFGGGPSTALRKVAIPGALPSLFAAARVSVPGAVTGALLAEWLSTGTGIGGQITKFNAQAQFDQLWASVAIITIITLTLYNIVQVIENVVLSRMGMAVTT